MASNHTIVINNFKPDETVSYSVIIIKGLIQNEANSTCQEEKISVSNISFKILGNKFKILTKLSPGANTITLKYCCSSTCIKIYYKRRETRFSVLPLYVICKGHDGQFQAPSSETNDVESALGRITLGAKLLQSVVAEKLFENNQGRKTFQLEDDCRVFSTKLSCSGARGLSQEELWSRIGKEIIDADLGHERVKFLAFLSCTRYCGEEYKDDFSHDDVLKITEAYVALGGGGLALFGTACLYTWPENLSQVIEKFENSSSVDRRNFMDDSCYRGTLGSCFSTTLGSVLHELCHSFDLGHTENGIMGRGFDDIYKVFLVFGNERDKMYQKSIEFKEEFEPERLSERLVEKRKIFLVRNGNVREEQDNTFWTRSCLTILSYHRWFNNFDSLKERVIKFDNATRVITSTGGLRVIEIRTEIDGLVILDWVFDGRVLKYSFHLPEDDLIKLEKPVMMFVEDNFGNIFKQILE